MLAGMPPAHIRRASASRPCIAQAWQDHQHELHNFLRHALGDAQAAEDVLQDTFVKALRTGPDFCTLDDPRAWLFRVARNTLTDRLRARRPHEPLEAHAEQLTQPEPAPAPAVDALSACLARVLDELAPSDADVLRACDLAGQTQQAYADAHGLGLPAVKSRLQRARQRLRERLTQACGVRFDPDDGRVCCHAGRRESA